MNLEGNMPMLYKAKGDYMRIILTVIIDILAGVCVALILIYFYEEHFKEQEEV